MPLASSCSRNTAKSGVYIQNMIACAEGSIGCSARTNITAPPSQCRRPSQGLAPVGVDGRESEAFVEFDRFLDLGYVQHRGGIVCFHGHDRDSLRGWQLLLQVSAPSCARLDGRGRPSLHIRLLFFWFFGVVDHVHYSASDGED